jgi:hypothetical protein
MLYAMPLPVNLADAAPPLPVRGHRRQVAEHLRVTPLDSFEWVRNALRLADYYRNMQEFLKETYCLTAADIIFARLKAKGVDGRDRCRFLIGVFDGSEVAAWGLSPVHALCDTIPSHAPHHTHPITTTTIPCMMKPVYPPNPLPGSCALPRWCQMAEASERYLRTSAELSVHWGQMYASILKLAFETTRAKGLGRSLPGIPKPVGPRPRSVVRAARAAVSWCGPPFK